MTKPIPLEKRELANLEALYDDLVKNRFLPTLKEYSGMAAEALALQVAIYRKRFATKYKVRVMPRALTFSARSSLVDFEALLLQLEQQEIKVTEIIYDPARTEFYIYAAV